MLHVASLPHKRLASMDMLHPNEHCTICWRQWAGAVGGGKVMYAEHFAEADHLGLSKHRLLLHGKIEANLQGWQAVT